MYDFHLKQKNSPYTSDYRTSLHYCTFGKELHGSTVKWFNNEKGYTFLTI